MNLDILNLVDKISYSFKLSQMLDLEAIFFSLVFVAKEAINTRKVNRKLHKLLFQIFSFNKSIHTSQRTPLNFVGILRLYVHCI